MRYPPAPWELYGQAHGHLFVVRAAALPPVPPGFKPLVVAGRALVIAGWVDYQPPSALTYGELFACVVGFAGRRPTGTVTHMWVDSEASMLGGRELWGYPKELAEFDVRIVPAGSARASAGGAQLARGVFRSVVRSPLRIKLKSGTFQPGHGFVRAVIRGRPELGGGSFDPGERLGFLRGATRLGSFALGDFHCTFGV